MSSNYDTCIICGTPMSPLSRHEHMSNGWVASICSVCRFELEKSCGKDISDTLLQPGSLVDKIINDGENDDDVISDLIKLIEEILDKKDSSFI